MNSILARFHNVNLNITSPTLWSTVTLLNTLLCILAITIWVTNRQTQIKKSKSQQKKRTRKDQEDHDGNEEILSRSDSDDDLEFYFNDWSRYNERRHLFMSINVDSDDNLEETSDGEEEDPDDFDGRQEKEGRTTKKEQQVVKEDSSNMIDTIPTASPQRKMRRELFKSISKLKVFSFLSDDAFLQCLNLMEYKDLPIRGMELFTTEEPFDGSLFIVIDGEMELSCSLCSSVVFSKEKPMSFTAGPGDVLTSLLSTLSGLLEEYKRVNIEFSNRFHEHSYMVNVIAKATVDNTRLIRIPPSAFLALLQSYPQDVHQIAQTVFARCQRVTIQTLVKNLGLGFDILYSHGNTNQVACNTWPNYKDELDKVVRDISSSKENDKKIDCAHDHSSLHVIEVSPETREKISKMLAYSIGSTDMDAIQMIQNESLVTVVKPGDVILQSNTKADFVYFIIDGVIDVEADDEQAYDTLSFQDDGKEKNRRLYQLFPGDVVGEMSCFTDEVSFVTLRVGGEQKKSALILQLPKSTYLQFLDKHSDALMQCIRKILTIDFSPLVHLFDWGIEWMHVQAGTLLASKHQMCDKLHVVLSGRLKVGTIDRIKGPMNSQHKNNYEYGRGSCIGETYILLGAEYPDDVYAVRNSELALLPRNVLDYIMHVFPHTAIHFAKQIASRQVPRYQRNQRRTRPFTRALPNGDISIATIAVVPLCFESTKEAHELCKSISHALNKLAPCTLMTKTIAKQSVGKKVFTLRNAVHELKMLKLLSDIEENHLLTVYQTDQKFTWWTKLCIQQADCVLLVADGQHVPSCEQLERYLIWAQGRSLVRHVQLLVLQQVYSDDKRSEKRVPISKDLSKWIDERSFVEGQHLVRTPIETYGNDVARLCRRITGMSLGLALGGGGARGLAHLGIIRALMERQVTVDICGGASQGAFIGALYAKNPDSYEDLVKAARMMATKMSSKKERLLDLTLPIVSYFNGSRFNNCIKDCIGPTTKINELILNFFCVSTDLCRSAQVIHTKGLCWKYLRASMSLHGYLVSKGSDSYRSE
mmetsp:Transcript_17528/g.33230  ORF Transcript_17528/g.33230 Transcript_17528/m.33230 type:complete len:1041 (+) Transcript_17528:87-3209(+)